MTEESKLSGKKLLPVVLGGAGVAIAGSLVAIFGLSTGEKGEEAAVAPPAAVAPANDQLAEIQFGQSGQTTPPTPPATPDPEAPLANADGSLAYADENISFSAAIPPGPANDPILVYLRTDAVNYFARYKANARTDADARRKAGAPAMAWEVLIAWKHTAKAGNITSLVGTAYEFTGGAHGMTYTDTHIARADTGEQIPFEAMLQSGAVSPALTIGVCEALKKVKLGRGDTATIFDDPIVCAGLNANISIEQAKFALAPSSEPGKFGGVFVYYDPYVVGSYAEGSYALVVPDEVFREDLRPEYKEMFGGDVMGEPS